MKNKKYTHVKIQGKWLRADIIHVYPKANIVWYQLKNNQGCGWVDEKYKVKVK